MESVLAKASESEIVSDPFPHLVIKNALDEDLYEKLSAEYPGIGLITQGKEVCSNERYYYAAHLALQDEHISPLWRDFISYHVSSAFYGDIIALFGDHIRALYPTLEVRFKKRLQDLSTGIRFQDEGTDIALECEFYVNTPVVESSRVRGPHVDNPRKLYVALLYFRADDDDSTGGDLELFRSRGSKFNIHGKGEINDRLVEKIKTVKYEKNTLVFFTNSLFSFHGVSARSTTEHSRRVVTMVGEFDEALY